MVRVSTIVFAAVSIAAVTAAPAYILTAEGVLPARDVLPADSELQGRGLKVDLLEKRRWRLLPHIPHLTGPSPPTTPSGNTEVPPTAAQAKAMGGTSPKVKGKTISKPGRKSSMKQRREVENELQARNLFGVLHPHLPHPLPNPIPWLPHIIKRPSGNTEATPSAGARAKVKASTGHTTSKKQKQKRESEAEDDLYPREVELLQEREPFLPLLL